jgi:DNA-binding SARP family transcriptional activator
MGRMDRWRVNLLGRFELRAPDGQEVALGARKSIALLALLAAAPGQRMSRDRVAVLLWEDMPDAQARGVSYWPQPDGTHRLWKQMEVP